MKKCESVKNRTCQHRVIINYTVIVSCHPNHLYLSTRNDCDVEALDWKEKKKKEIWICTNWSTVGWQTLPTRQENKRKNYASVRMPFQLIQTRGKRVPKGEVDDDGQRLNRKRLVLRSQTTEWLFNLSLSISLSFFFFFFLRSSIPMKNRGRNDDRCVRRYTRPEEREQRKGIRIYSRCVIGSKRSDGSTSR